MLILAVETTGDVCSIALRDAMGTLAERAFRHRMHLSERLISEVDSVLSDGGITLAEVDGLAAGIGPGSFTGVRLGVTTIKTWADLLQKPVVGVSALDALAETCFCSGEVLIAPVVRARPGAFYSRLFRRSDGAAPIPTGEPGLYTVTEFVEAIVARMSTATAKSATVLMCGDALPRYRADIDAGLVGAGFFPLFGPSEAPRASLLAEIAAKRLAVGLSDNALELTPLYLAPPPIGAPPAAPPR